MKEKQLKISEFINSLSADASTEGIQSVLLSSELVGAGSNQTNSWYCHNSSEDCVMSRNQYGCINYSGHCAFSTNVKDCRTTGDPISPGM